MFCCVSEELKQVQVLSFHIQVRNERETRSKASLPTRNAAVTDAEIPDPWADVPDRSREVSVGWRRISSAAN